jgi:hypothetical protein
MIKAHGFEYGVDTSTAHILDPGRAAAKRPRTDSNSCPRARPHECRTAIYGVVNHVRGHHGVRSLLVRRPDMGRERMTPRRTIAVAVLTLAVAAAAPSAVADVLGVLMPDAQYGQALWHFLWGLPIAAIALGIGR